MILGTVIVQGIGENSLMVVKTRALISIKKSPFQEIIVAEVGDFGKALVLDGYIQSTTSDEFIYHESLVHPAMVLHPDPRRVLIIGGGEGATLREVLKHSTVEEAIMVDIDKDVVELAKEHLPEMHQGSFFDRRARVVIDDGKRFVEKEYEKGVQYDVVILDLTDPYSSEIAKDLYTEQFFVKTNSILAENGVMVTQAGSRFFYTQVYEYVANNIKSVFRYVAEYQVWIPSFGYSCNFIIGSKKIDTSMLLNSEYVDDVLRSRKVSTRFINGKRVAALLLMGIY
ncbi:MAG: spermidine synthase [Ignisphaera sp.]